MIMAASSSHEPAAASNRPCCSSSCCCFSLAAAAAAAAAASDQQQQTVVMTDEQLKTFRGQLTTYATICAQLVETHNKQSNPQPSARAGSSPGQKGMQKMGSKNRWTPTPKQLQILKKLFEEVNGTPTREQIIAVTEQLSQHGPISKASVSKWFQNHKARGTFQLKHSETERE
ncbi:hypothetical protein O6H91_06G090700 [Diphasiastrum complanatum]|uniref:Uncharacterized protein n=1 Tax=Diphasiastrum complanatum TaxID=34168 RepID=A0ACC2DG85_DIPCM|nr:hypothetical protein O6H91_06G090700 [Diphasiastrum complanatum]